MNDLVVYLVVVPVSLVAGAVIGFFIFRHISKKQMEKWQKKMKEPDKEQVRSMLSALGKKPSEEQVNRFVNMAKSAEKKKAQKPKKTSSKKKK